MHFAAPFPPWFVVFIVVAVIAVAVLAYRRPLVPLAPSRRVLLAALRAAALAALALFLARPTILVPPATAGDRVVPVLIDASRSMRVPDGPDGRSRLDAARDILVDRLLPDLSRHFKPELYAFGETVAATTPEALVPEARHSDLAGAVATIEERYRGRPIAGIVLITDGGDTSAAEVRRAGAGGLPVYPIGVGTANGVPDRELVGIVAGDPRLDAATIDLHVTAVSRGFGRRPLQLRLLADGRVIEARSLEPAADGAPVEASFTVLPNAASTTVYTADLAVEGGEAITENNKRSVLVSPPGRKRHILALEGAPGFDHSFMARSLSADQGLELDIVVRKGRNDAGQDTFFVQAGGGRAQALASGFPASRDALFAYDAVIVANVESDAFTRAQLQLMADFVADRGGGLLVFGARSFAQRGLIGTPLEEVLPVELNDRRGALSRVSLDADALPRQHTVALTADGEAHPIMRLGRTGDDTRRAWAALPALASASALGGPRPGASVLAVTSTGGGGVVPLVAVQRYGRGRSMVFTGEASWRWRMMMPASDRSHEFFWRQALRWLSVPAPEPVEVTLPDAIEVGDAATIAVEARDAGFLPVPEAVVDASMTRPDGVTETVAVTRDARGTAHFGGTFRPAQPGLHRVRAAATRGDTDMGASERWFFVGGADREFADPRLNEGVLHRLAGASGGRYAAAADVSQVAGWLETAAPHAAQPEPRDLWHEPWAFGLLIALLSAEWVLRRLWGLR